MSVPKGMQVAMRLVTKQAKQLASGKTAVRSGSERVTGLTVTSADAVRFAYTSTPLPTYKEEKDQKPASSKGDGSQTPTAQSRGK
jgi:hypothetical protein